MKNRLKDMRLQQGLTQIALQNRVQIDQGTLSRYEKGERVPTTANLVTLANYYDVSIDYLLCRTDNPEMNK